MYIVNKHGIIRNIPDDYDLPTGGRKATQAEASYCKRTGDQIAANVPKVKPGPKPKRKPKAVANG